MKAIAYHAYGSPDVLDLEDVERPVVKDGEVLVRVRAASPNPYDWHFMRGVPYFMRLTESGIRAPKQSVLGSDIAGRVEAVGKEVTRFQPGDEVFANVGSGGFAEYTCVPEDLLGLKPANLTFEQAAAVPLAAMTALQGLRDAGKLQSGQKVLIIGASGGVGTFAVQIAKRFGAHVTGVCSARNLDMVRSIGADDVIDYTTHDFTQDGPKYDLVFQLAGTQAPSDLRRVLTPKGTLVLSSGDSEGRWIGPVDRVLKAVALSPFVGQSLRPFLMKPSAKDLEFLRELIEAGELEPIIDRTYSLSEVPEAIRYLEQGHARGKVVIDIP
jgi:NADPH:quinone reductase-like Zn-dependent oxidoreductase